MNGGVQHTPGAGQHHTQEVGGGKEREKKGHESEEDRAKT